MIDRMYRYASARTRSVARAAALVILLTVAATVVWAHAGHHALPTRGVDTSELAQGKLIISRESREVLDVKTAEVEPHAIEDKILAYATLVAPWQQHAYITTRLAGRITKLNVRPGQAVAAGQVIAEVESLELENLQLELLNAQNDVQLSTKVLEQLEPLAKQGAIPEKDVREARSKHQQNVNSLELARAKWLSVGLSGQALDKLLQERNPRPVLTVPLASPISGTVIHADLTVGKVVEPAEHLFEIIDLSKVWVKIGVLEQDLHQVAVGQRVELSVAAYPGEVFQTTVGVKGLYLDPETHLGAVWADLDNPSGAEPRFLPGMSGQARVVLPAPKKRLTVPASSLITDGAERYVLVENEATEKVSEYQKRAVVTGVRTPDLVQIREGEVYAGDRVVTTGGHELSSFFVQGVLHLSSQAAKNIGLRVEPAQLRVVEDVIEVDGAVDVPPDRRAFASSQLSGTLQAIRVERGQAVRAGDVLADVASLEFQNLQLDLLRAHLQLGLLEDTLQRLRTADQILARKQLWETESLYNETRNRRDSLQRKLEAVGLSRQQVEAVLAERKFVETLPLRSPIDGVVAHFDQAIGQAVKAEEPSFEIHDLSHPWVQGFLSERELPAVRVGQQARVRLESDPGFLAEAVVTRSGHVVGEDSRTLSVWAELKKEPGLAVLEHNMLARLTLTVARPEPTLAVPRAAVILEGTQAYVFVQRPDEVFERRPVDIGRADDRFVEIRNGLQPGEKVAVEGAADLRTAYASLR